jgi:hypothetical protein
VSAAVVTARAAVPSADGGERGAVLALARVEAARLLHPLVRLALALYLVWTLWRGLHTAGPPVLQDVDRGTQSDMQLLGLVTLVLANLAALRSHRHDTEAHFAVLVLRPRQRTAAHLLSVLPMGVLAAVIVAARFGSASARPGAVGHGSVFELASGPAAVLLLGGAGVLLARLSSSSFTAPIAVLVLIAIVYVFVNQGPAWARWLLPVRVEDGADPLPSSLLGRPAGWHVLYLLAFAVLLGAAAVLRSGGRAAAVRATALGALVVTAGAAVAQGMAPADSVVAARQRATERPAGTQSCRAIGPTTYCSFPEFAPWAGRWDAVVRRVRALVPGDAGREPLTVRQHVYAEAGPSGLDGADPVPPPAGSWPADDRAAGTPGAVTVGTAPGGSADELVLATGAAYALVTGRTPGDAGRGAMCDGRGVLVLWLAAEATSRTGDDLASAVSRVDGGGVLVESPAHGTGESVLRLRDQGFAVVRALLDRPRADVERRVGASWAELSAPGTSTGRAARLLGVRAPALTGKDRRSPCA